MLCEVCDRMLRLHEGRLWKGTHDLIFTHHTSGKELQHSAKRSCGICHAILEEICAQLKSPYMCDDLQLSIKVSLSLFEHPRLYRLDFKSSFGQMRCQNTFILRKTDYGDLPHLVPISHNTSSDEVDNLVLRWMSQCRCIDPSIPPSWYPARLISLAQLKTENFLRLRKLGSANQQQIEEKMGQTLVKLEEIADWVIPNKPPHNDVHYVTLSHCWGKSGSTKLMLNSRNIDTLKHGVRLKDLPKTFRDAIDFAARIPQVGYIWIDSLCIKQGPEEVDDWLIQSVTMHKVYSETFLNISATAASNSEGGLFFRRKPELLLADELLLNIEGIPGIKNKSAHLCTGHEMKNTSPYYAQSRTASKDNHNDHIESENLIRCTILDVSFWARTVDKAPVNRRGWVVQERLLSPRILHFCHDQVAWECKDFDAAEALPQHMPNYQLDGSGVVDERPLKSLDPQTDGKRLRFTRLRGYEDPDPHLQPQIFALELWRYIVELYSRTAISFPGDKLIALHGMAQRMAPLIGNKKEPAEYVAGLWKDHLASQLLWSIIPVFRRTGYHFEHSSSRPTIYRAPSWSWAAIDVQSDFGLSTAEVTDNDIYIKVEGLAFQSRTEPGSRKTTEHVLLYLHCQLRKASISIKERGRFGWKLVGLGPLDEEEHTNVYLDCPTQDGESILHPHADIFVIPAAMGERTASSDSKYMICLLLQLIKGHPDGPAFRRVGLSKLSPWANGRTIEKIRQPFRNDIHMPHQGYDESTGMHRILLI